MLLLKYLEMFQDKNHSIRHVIELQILYLTLGRIIRTINLFKNKVTGILPFKRYIRHVP